MSADGWIGTGDLGALPPDGYLRVTGRLKDLIIRGGENIAAVGVEDIIRAALPDVLDVSVVGVPDEFYGEAVAAFLRLRDGASLTTDEILAALAGQLPRYQVPSHVRIVGQFPLTPSGKVQKHVLRERFIKDEPLGELKTELARRRRRSPPYGGHRNRRSVLRVTAPLPPLRANFGHCRMIQWREGRWPHVKRASKRRPAGRR